MGFPSFSRSIISSYIIISYYISVQQKFRTPNGSVRSFTHLDALLGFAHDIIWFHETGGHGGLDGILASLYGLVQARIYRKHQATMFLWPSKRLWNSGMGSGNQVWRKKLKKPDRLPWKSWSKLREALTVFQCFSPMLMTRKWQLDHGGPENWRLGTGYKYGKWQENLV